jgi:hypothetical protein
VRWSVAGKDVSAEAEESTSLVAVIKQGQVKTQPTEDFKHAVVICSVCEYATAL